MGRDSDGIPDHPLSHEEKGLKVSIYTDSWVLANDQKGYKRGGRLEF